MSACSYLVSIDCVFVVFTYRCFTLVQLHTSRQAALSQQPHLGDDELVEL